MEIKITGQHVDLGATLRAHIENSLSKSVAKYFDGAISGTVNMTKNRHHLFTTEIMVNEGTGNGVLIKAEEDDADAHRSYDLALEKIEKQLRRYKNRIKDHAKRKQEVREFFSTTKMIMSPYGDNEVNTSDAPAIIAETAYEIEKLSVGDAVMKMDLHDVPALMFFNKGTSRMNMVYYRKDGNIAWVDAPEKMAS